MKTYNKLIRDRIPEIIRSSGKQCEVVIMNEADYEAALRDKLVEEADEARHAEEGHLLTELADIQEVIHSLLQLHGIAYEQLEAEQRRRNSERGGFTNRFKLICTD
jgi:predicted house-cleaning noncanonical NTP pyrophosphatase (MazG superfamily)